MRTYPHAPDGPALQNLFQTFQDLSFPVAMATPEFMAGRTVDFWTDNAAMLLDVARLAYALEQDAAMVRHHLRESSDCFARGVAEGAPFDLDHHFDQLGTAIVLADGGRVDLLCNLPAARHVVRGVSFPASDERRFEVLSDLAAGRSQAAAARLPEATAALARDRLPKQAQEDTASALEIQQRLLQRDAAGLSRAFARRAAAYAAKFRHPEIVNSPQSLLDLNGLALAALARATGLQVQIDSVYLPLSLLDA